jgi:glutamate N-acetyltransferase/amino-acid N-acetyltransferase
MAKKTMIRKVQGGVTAPKGFKASGVRCGLKSRGNDLVLIYTETPAVSAGVFTRNQVCAPAVELCRKRLRRPMAHAIISNSGNANTCTGEQGMKDAEEMAALAAGRLGLQARDVFMASTGIIGHPLAMDKIRGSMDSLCESLSRSGSEQAAQAMMTTDTVPKSAARRVRIGDHSVTLGGVAKGSGMIHPNMGTMHAFLSTDAAVSTSCLRRALRDAADETFNMITVDGDTSTSDTVLLLANGLAGNKPIDNVKSDSYLAFSKTLTDLCRDLAIQIARDGEGATTLVTVQVHGGRSVKDARAVAKSVAESNLVKTAVFGRDPNVGRILCAVGYSSAKVDPERLDVWVGSCKVAENGQVLAETDLSKAHDEMDAGEVVIRVELKMGKSSATAWTCDLTYDYIRINAEYHT